MGTHLSHALFGATRQAVLSSLFSHPDERFYQRQIIRMAGLGSGTVQRELEQLTNAGVLIRTVEGHQTYYQANPTCPVYEDLRSLVRKTFGVTQILQASLQSIARQVKIAFIYGSLADGSEKPSSDIDVMLVGDGLTIDAVVSALATAQHELRREVNPTVYNEGEFYRKLGDGHHFVSSVMRGPKMFLMGDEGELTRLAQERLAKGASAKPPRNRGSVRRRRS